MSVSQQSPRRIRQYFITGIAVLLPIAVTIAIFSYLWSLADSALVNPVYHLIQDLIPYQMDESIAVYFAKAVILVVLLIGVCLLGLVAELFVVKQMIKIGEAIVSKVPMVNKVYSVLKEISATFFGKNQKDLFRKAVLIEYPRSGLWSVAFITRSSHEVVDHLIGKKMISVFVPTTPNPTSGVLIFVDADQVKDLPYSVEDAVKLVISAGSLADSSKRQTGV